MIRMTEVPTAPTLSPTISFSSHTSRSKTRPVFLSQHVDLSDEPNCDSVEAIPPHLDELKSSSCSTFPSPSNSPGLLKFFTPPQVWGEVPEDAKMPTIECKQVVEAANPKAHSTCGNPSHLLFWVNLLISPSQSTFVTTILHLISHLKMWINQVISVTPPEPLTVGMKLFLEYLR